MNRTERRRIERRMRRLTAHIEEQKARLEMIQLVQNIPAHVTITGKLDTGADFALCAAPNGLRYGERDPDGFCSIEAYGPDGEHVYGWGGDNLDLLQEVKR